MIHCSVAGKKAIKYINELIKAGNLTGLQAGKALIYDLINSQVRKENTSEDNKNLIEVYKKIRKNLLKWNNQELLDYERYRGLYNWILRTHPEALGKALVAQVCIEHFDDITSTMCHAEKIVHLVDDTVRNSSEQKKAEETRARTLKNNKLFAKNTKEIKKMYSKIYANPTPLESLKSLTLDRYTKLDGEWENQQFLCETTISGDGGSDRNYLRGTLEKIYEGRLEKNYYYLQGYNKSLEIIAKRVAIPELEAMYFDLNFFDRFNNCIAELKKTVAKSGMSQPHKDRKQKKIDDVFPLINFKRLKTPKNKIQKACCLLDKGLAFADGDYRFIDLFTQKDASDDK